MSEIEAFGSVVDAALEEIIAKDIAEHGESHVHDPSCRTWRGLNWAGACDCRLAPA